MSAPQPIAVGEPTGRFPRKLPLGDRHVGSSDTAINNILDLGKYNVTTSHGRYNSISANFAYNVSNKLIIS